MVTAITFLAMVSVVAQPTVNNPTPASAVRCTGQLVTYTVTWSGGTGPYTVQWFRDGSTLVQQTMGLPGFSDSLTIFPIAATDAGTYTATVTDSGSMSGTTALGSVLTVEIPVQILAQPTDTTLCPGLNANFSVTVGGTAPTFQWQYAPPMGSFAPLTNGDRMGRISGADTATLTIAATVAGDAGQYRCRVSNLCGSPPATTTQFSIGANLSVDSSLPTFATFPMSPINADTGGSGGMTCDSLVTWTEPTYSDDCGAGSVTSAVSFDATMADAAPTGFTQGAPGGMSSATFAKGTTVVTYDIMDATGNMAQMSFNVIVVDNTEPVVDMGTCPPALTLNAGPAGVTLGSIVTLPTFTDNCDGSVTPVCVDQTMTPVTGATMLPAGATTITCTATDMAGNTSAPCTFTIVVCDPSLTGTVIVDDDFTGTPDGTEVEPGFFYNCNAFDNIPDAITAVNSGGTIDIRDGTYPTPAQQAVAKPIAFQGPSSPDVATVVATTSTGTSGNARGWFWMSVAGTSFSNLNFDGGSTAMAPVATWQILRFTADGTVTDCDFANAVLPAPTYQGTAIAGTSSASLMIARCSMANIGRIGIHVFGPMTTIDELTYTGKGPGDHIDYACCIGGVAATAVAANITRSTVTGNTGVASSDGSTSAGILCTTFFGSTSVDATISNCFINGNTTGVLVGFNSADLANVTVFDCDLSGNSTATVASNSTVTTTNASGNWHGSNDPAVVGPFVSANVDYTPWLDSGSDTDGGTPGFQGSFVTVHVDDDSDQTGTSNRIQEGVDIDSMTMPPSSSRAVRVHPGTYAAPVIVARSLTLISAAVNSSVIPCDPMTGMPIPRTDESTIDAGTGEFGIVVHADSVSIEGMRFINCWSAVTNQAGNQVPSTPPTMTGRTIATNIRNCIVESPIENPNAFHPVGSARGFDMNFAQSVTIFDNLLDNGASPTAPNFWGIICGRVGSNAGDQLIRSTGLINTNCIRNARFGITAHAQTFLIQDNHVSGYVGSGACVPSTNPTLMGPGCPLGSVRAAVGILARADNSTISGNTVLDYDGSFHPPFGRGEVAFAGIALNADIGFFGPVGADGSTVTDNTLTNNIIGVAVGAGATNITVSDNASITGSDVAIAVQGSATITSPGGANITGNAIGVLADGSLSGVIMGLFAEGLALIENEDLSGHTEACIAAVNGAQVDAGGCEGMGVPMSASEDFTGLGTGSLTTGASSGGNVLTGSMFNSMAPFALSAMPTGPAAAPPMRLRALENSFGAGASDDVATAVNGMSPPISYAQSGVYTLTCPPAGPAFQCQSLVPAAHASLAAFIMAGGSASLHSSSAVLTVDADVVAGNDCSGSVMRTYRLVDDCGERATCLDTLTVMDSTDPVFSTFPANVTVQCNDPVDPGSTGSPTAADNCGGMVSITSSDMMASTMNPSCPTEMAITRTWTAEDSCGNSVSMDQIITITDTGAPTVTPPANTCNEGCAALPGPGTLGMATAIDDCDMSPMMTGFVDTDLMTTTPPMGVMTPACAMGMPGPCVVTIIERSFTFTDNCGNMASASQYIWVVDTTAPVLAGVPGDTTVECDAVPTAAMPTATDNCDMSPGIVFGTMTAAGSCANESVITRTWTATDACGNSSVETQVITVVDTTAPVLSGVPADTTVECDSIPAPAVPTASDNCDPMPGIGFTQTPTPGACADAFTLTRTWIATDACGNSSTMSQVITVVDTTAPVLSGVPADVTVECDSIPTAPTVTATDNCDMTVTPVFAEMTAGGSCADESTITRTWTATDDCGNSVVGTQVITVVDTTAPVLAGVPADTTVECDSVPMPASPTATDNCDTSVDIVFAEVNTPGTCPDSYMLTRTWTATDNCSNSVVGTQVITVVDTTDPVLVGVPVDTTVECNAVPMPPMVTATDNCDGAPTVGFSEMTTPGVCMHESMITRTWTATDACGNSSTEVQVISVVDTTAPVFDAMSLPTTPLTVECDSVPMPASVTATDNCDMAPVITFSEVSDMMSCPETITRTWDVVDDCGNMNTFVQTITVVDTTAPMLVTPCPGDITIHLGIGECDGSATWTQPTATDNCDMTLTGVLNIDGMAEPIPAGAMLTRTLDPGTHNVNYSFTDDCGNVEDCSFTITLIGDWKAPVDVAVDTNPVNVDTADFGTVPGNQAADFFADILTVNSSGSLTLLYNDQNGGFSNTPATAETIMTANLMMAGDAPVDVDSGGFVAGGGRDIAVAVRNAGGDKVVVIANDGISAFTETIVHTIPGSINVQAIAAGDLDANGVMDAVLCSRGLDSIPVGSGSGVFVMLNNALPVALTGPAGLSRPRDVALCDMDGDTDLDVVVVDNVGRALFWTNDGLGGMTFNGQIDSASTATNSGLSYADFPPSPVSICCGDLDSDLIANDIAILGAPGLAQGTVMILVNNENGGAPVDFMDPSPTDLAGFGATDIACGDIRNDSIGGGFPGNPASNCAADLVVANSTPGVTNEDINQFLGYDCSLGGPAITGIGTRVSCELGDVTSAVAIEDLNPLTDLLPELIVAHTGSSTVTILCANTVAVGDCFGTACGGTLGLPVMSVPNLPIEGQNATVRMTLTPPTGFTNPLGGAILVVSGISFPSTLAPGCTFYLGAPTFVVGPPTGFPIIMDVAEFTFPIPMGFIGDELFFQWGVQDPTGPVLPGISLSKAARLRVGF